MHATHDVSRFVPLHVLGAILVSALLAVSQAPSEARATEASLGSSAGHPELPAGSLDALADVVRDYVERDMVVGAELLVMEDREVVLHKAFGWRDRAAELPMERDTLFNIRSMTKPVTGAAAQILIDEGRLALDDRVSDYIAGFGTDAAREITIEQLLTHQSGLPLGVITSTRDFESLQAMADAIGEVGPEFEPGSRFWYSDAGADVLGAVVERASGMTLSDFVGQRLLGPLGMTDTTYLEDPDDALLDRVASLYVGGVGEWTRFWGPGDPPFYPFAWGSQGLYSTPLDYARFLAMWLDGGRSDGARILSPEAVSRMLTPTAAMSGLGSDAPYPTRYPDLRAYHGQMAVLHAATDSMDGVPPQDVEPTVVGYSGSDGTIAWAWPDRDLMILYFTQSRGGATPLRLEAEIDRLLLHPPQQPVPDVPEELAACLGTYTANFGPFHDQPFEIVWRDGNLALDVPSQFVFPLDQDVEEGQWTLRDDPGVAISFVADETGAVTGMRIDQGGVLVEVPKGVPEPGVERPLEPEAVAPYLGWYRDAETEREVQVLLRDGRLAIRIPESSGPLDLFPPDEEGVWRLRLDPTVEFRFIGEDGAIVSYVVSANGEEATFTRLAEQDPA